MYKTTIEIHGMMCGMCESHINDTIRKAFPQAKKVSSSKAKKQTTFLTEEPVAAEDVRAAIQPTGYEYISSKCEEYVKRGLFG